MKLHEARKARLEPHLLKTSTSSATPQAKVAVPCEKIRLPVITPSTTVTAGKSREISHSNEAAPKPLNQVALLAKKGGLEVSNMEIFIPKVFDNDWRDGNVTPPLFTSSSYKIFTPEKSQKQLALTNTNDVTPANSNEFNLGLLDESAGSLVEIEGGREKFQANLSDIDELLGESVNDERAVSKEKGFKFVSTRGDEQEDVEELERKQKMKKNQRPQKISTKLQSAIKKSWKNGSTTLVKQKGRRTDDNGKGAHKVRKLERDHRVYSAIEQETASRAATDAVDEKMEVDDEDGVPLSIPMTSSEIRERVIKNVIKKGKEGKSNEQLLQINDMMEH